MAHHTPVLSPAGTPLQERTVGELVAQHPGTSRVFQAHGIDFCCQGHRTVREACQRLDQPLDRVATELEAALAGPSTAGTNPAELTPADLVAHIVAHHHGYLRSELPRLHEMAHRVARRHGGHTPTLIEVFHVFETLATELERHLREEEQTTFPALLRQFSQAGATEPLEGALQALVDDHAAAAECLVRLRELTAGFIPPPEACNTYRALFAGLAELETDLHRHLHLENNVLFPAALARRSA